MSLILGHSRQPMIRALLIAVAGLAVLAACSSEPEKQMGDRMQVSFDDPALQKAATAISAGETDAALDQARVVRDRINAVDPSGATLLKIAIKRNDLRAVQGLLALRADPNVPREAAPIAAAAEWANAEVVRALLDVGADPNGVANGESALWRAATGDRRDVVQLLLQHGALVDKGDADGETPAMAAVQSSHFQVAIMLLQRGASPFVKSFEGKSLAFWANQSRINPQSEEGHARDHLIAMLASAGAD